jgi:hypothetical protein
MTNLDTIKNAKPFAELNEETELSDTHFRRLSVGKGPRCRSASWANLRSWIRLPNAAIAGSAT